MSLGSKIKQGRFVGMHFVGERGPKAFIKKSDT